MLLLLGSSAAIQGELCPQTADKHHVVRGLQGNVHALSEGQKLSQGSAVSPRVHQSLQLQHRSLPSATGCPNCPDCGQAMRCLQRCARSEHVAQGPHAWGTACRLTVAWHSCRGSDVLSVEEAAGSCRRG